MCRCGGAATCMIVMKRRNPYLCDALRGATCCSPMALGKMVVVEGAYVHVLNIFKL